MWFHKVSGRSQAGLLADDDEGRALLARMGEGECCQVKIIRPRSVSWNNMYFAICTEIGSNQDPKRDKDSIDQQLRILAGHYDVIYVGRRPMPWWFGALARILESKGGLGRWLINRLRTKLGHADEVYVPKRIAFDKLSADEWAELWPSLELAIREHFGEEYIRESRAA